jgi:hypothetical protein
MVRTQIQLTTDQARNLKKMALARQTSVAELIRQAVDDLIKTNARMDTLETKKRALDIVGKYRSGKKDISRKHDAFLSEAFSK